MALYRSVGHLHFVTFFLSKTQDTLSFLSQHKQRVDLVSLTLSSCSCLFYSICIGRKCCTALSCRNLSGSGDSGVLRLLLRCCWRVADCPLLSLEKCVCFCVCVLVSMDENSLLTSCKLRHLLSQNVCVCVCVTLECLSVRGLRNSRVQTNRGSSFPVSPLLPISHTHTHHTHTAAVSQWSLGVVYCLSVN